MELLIIFNRMCENASNNYKNNRYFNRLAISIVSMKLFWDFDFSKYKKIIDSLMTLKLYFVYESR